MFGEVCLGTCTLEKGNSFGVILFFNIEVDEGEPRLVVVRVEVDDAVVALNGIVEIAKMLVAQAQVVP